MDAKIVRSMKDDAHIFFSVTNHHMWKTQGQHALIPPVMEDELSPKGFYPLNPNLSSLAKIHCMPTERLIS